MGQGDMKQRRCLSGVFRHQCLKAEISLISFNLPSGSLMSESLQKRQYLHAKASSELLSPFYSDLILSHLFFSFVTMPCFFFLLLRLISYCLISPHLTSSHTFFLVLNVSSLLGLSHLFFDLISPQLSFISHLAIIVLA